jgi:hypothetical protein
LAWLFSLLFAVKRLLWNAEQRKQLTLQVGELDMKDLAGACALG